MYIMGYMFHVVKCSLAPVSASVSPESAKVRVWRTLVGQWQISVRKAGEQLPGVALLCTLQSRQGAVRIYRLADSVGGWRTVGPSCKNRSLWATPSGSFQTHGPR